jgi:hypothetical protein
MANGALGVNASKAAETVQAVSFTDLARYMVQVINDGQTNQIDVRMVSA